SWEGARWAAILETAKSNNTSRFWKLIADDCRDSVSVPGSSILSAAWVYHFSLLYDGPSETSPRTLDVPIIQGDTPIIFTLAETSRNRLIEMGKGPWSRQDLGDLYKSRPDIWAPYLNLICNAIAAGAPVPSSWKGAEIVPIFKQAFTMQ
ncbi:hypothetical protein NDU88_010564, partial [Pleurodeles waltl]